MRLMRGLKPRKRHTHFTGQRCAALVERHQPVAHVVLTVRHYFSGRRLIEDQPKGCLALPHLTSNPVATAELITDAVAILVEDYASGISQGLRSQERDPGVAIVGLHEARGVNVNPLEVRGSGTCGLGQSDAVAGGVVAARRGQVQQVRSVLGKEAACGEICREPSSAQNDWPLLLQLCTSLHVSATPARALCHQQSRRPCTHDYSRPAGLACLLHSPEQRAGERAAREVVCPAVGPGCGVAAQVRQEGQLRADAAREPIYVLASVVSKCLNQIGPFTAALGNICGEQLGAVMDASLHLHPCTCRADAIHVPRSATTTSRPALKNHHPGPSLQRGARCCEAGHAAAHDDDLAAEWFLGRVITTGEALDLRFARTGPRGGTQASLACQLLVGSLPGASRGGQGLIALLACCIL
mmetsp:Transcript_19162/g.55644  ORF Transcript_19162/g.55644 Transcript_19162/m.55644 type:complete len:412 (-) Transcript_19162:86-1321(-)